ncbi:MAG TPA: ATP-binding protein [Gemmata sp.]
MSSSPITETVTLSQSRDLIRCLSQEQSVLLLAPAGVGKSDVVHQAAAAEGLECKSLLGTQIAPEGVSGVPAGGAKSVLLAAVEHRLGEFRLPPGTWVVAAGNRTEDRALVRTLSSALVNRVFVLRVRVDLDEWLLGAECHGVRAEVRSFIRHVPSPFSAQCRQNRARSRRRAWALVSRDLELAEPAGRLTRAGRRALAFARLTPHDAALFYALCEDGLVDLRPASEYSGNPALLPKSETAMWFVVNRIRQALGAHLVRAPKGEEVGFGQKVSAFLGMVGEEYRFALLLDHVEEWAALGAHEVSCFVHSKP